MRHKVRVLMIGGVLLSFLAGCGIPARDTTASSVTPASSGASAATLWSQAADVTYLARDASGDQQETVPAVTSRDVATGDKVGVKDVGEALLEFRNKLEVRVFRNSTLSLDPRVKGDASTLERVRLTGGAAFNMPTLKEIADQRVRVETEWAVIEDSGTQFWVYEDSVSHATWIVVQQGTVKVTAKANVPQNVVVVPAGWQTWVEPNQAPQPPVPATRAAVGNRFQSMDVLTHGAAHPISEQEIFVAAAASLPPAATAQAASAAASPSAGSSVTPRASVVASAAPVAESPAPFTATATLDVTPSSSTSCPTTFTFTATIRASSPGTVTYRWQRSDPPGWSGPTEQLDFQAADSKTVEHTWTLDQRGDPYRGWVALQILSPDQTTSPQVSFMLDCLAPSPPPTPPTITVSASPSLLWYGEFCSSAAVATVVADTSDPSGVIATMIVRYEYQGAGKTLVGPFEAEMAAKPPTYTAAIPVDEELSTFGNRPIDSFVYSVSAFDTDGTLIETSKQRQAKMVHCPG